MILGIILALIIGTAIAKPIEKLIKVAKLIASGNLADADNLISMIKKELKFSDSEKTNSEKSLDEPGQLLRAFSAMAKSLSSLIKQIQRSSVQLLSSATQIAAASREQEATINNLGSSTTQIAASVKEISATSQELVKTMSQVSSVAVQTESLADSGRTSLNEMIKAIKDLTQATRSISAKLAVINDKTNNIGTIMTTINKVADQTNLLSLNAAIEAEKAGEHGLGFGVVAREIRRLADQTAVATLDIEQMIREMQSSVASGVMEMDKFNETMKKGIDDAGNLGKRMEQIITQVSLLMPRFQIVEEGMRSQSQGAQQINDSMIILSSITHNTMESLREFNKATESLHMATRDMNEEISRFRVKDN